MSLSYADLNEKITGIKQRLDACANKLEGIEPAEKAKYENPQYRLWTGDAKDLEEFSVRLEEWLSQPDVSEAKRYLADLGKWSNSQEKIPVEKIEGDWEFLASNIEGIREIHKLIGGIDRTAIKGIVSTWSIKRIIEKDIEHAENWASNAHKFAAYLRQIESTEVESNLAMRTKEDSVKALLKISSFDKDNKETIEKYEDLIKKAENIIEYKPAEVEERAVLQTYEKADSEVETKLSTVNEGMETIRGLLIDMEWIKQSSVLKDYNNLWNEKTAAIKESDLEGIANALKNVQQKANQWKKARQQEIEADFLRIQRMAKSIEENKLKTETISLGEEIRNINWNKPDLKSVSNILSKMNDLRNRLQEELRKKLQDRDAISIVEEPEIIKDLAKNKGWDFERFIKALEVVLRNGLIEIEPKEGK